MGGNKIVLKFFCETEREREREREDGCLRAYDHLNSISVISGRWEGDNERSCAMETRQQLISF